MGKTSVEIDRDIADQVALILGTSTLRETIDAALHEVIDARRRLELVAMFAEPDRFDFSGVDAAWRGTE